MTILRTLGLVAAALAFLWSPTPVLAGTEPVEPDVPTVLDATEDEIAKVMEAAEKAKAEKDDELLMQCPISMGTHRAEQFKPVMADNIDHKDADLQATALRAAASHEMSELAKDVLKILKKSKKSRKGKSKDEGDVSGKVAAAAIEFLARLAIEGAEEEVADNLTRLFQVESRMQASFAPDLVKAAVYYLGQMKTKSAVPQLVEMVREPYPEDPGSGTNPPASYWEARYKIWQASEGWVRWALKEITGQEFRTHREWAAWLDANKKEYGK